MPPYVYRIRTRHEAMTQYEEYDDFFWMSHRLNADSIDEARAACVQRHAEAYRVPADVVEVVETLGGSPLYPHIR